MRIMVRVVSALVLLCFAVSAQEAPKPAPASGSTAEFKIPPEAAKLPNPVKPTPSSLAQGKKSYGYDCAVCHGKDGDGKGDLAGDMNLKLADYREPAALKDYHRRGVVLHHQEWKRPDDGRRRPRQIRGNLEFGELYPLACKKGWGCPAEASGIIEHQTRGDFSRSLRSANAQTLNDVSHVRGRNIVERVLILLLQALAQIFRAQCNWLRDRSNFGLRALETPQIPGAPAPAPRLFHPRRICSPSCRHGAWRFRSSSAKTGTGKRNRSPSTAHRTRR